MMLVLSKIHWVCFALSLINVVYSLQFLIATPPTENLIIMSGSRRKKTCETSSNLSGQFKRWIYESVNLSKDGSSFTWNVHSKFITFPFTLTFFIQLIKCWCWTNTEIIKRPTNFDYISFLATCNKWIQYFFKSFGFYGFV